MSASMSPSNGSPGGGFAASNFKFFVLSKKRIQNLVLEQALV